MVFAADLQLQQLSLQLPHGSHHAADRRGARATEQREGGEALRLPAASPASASVARAAHDAAVIMATSSMCVLVLWKQWVAISIAAMMMP